ncbi:hypothetical protein Tco_1367906 [Tanacetum coccineum]
MDSIIPLGQKNTLVEYMILSGADNRPPMLDKDMYDSWKSRMKLYMQNREHGRMILESVEHGPLIWPIVEENRVTRTNKYAELSAVEKMQADCDMKATNIILQGLAVLIFSPRDDPIACLNKAMAFLTSVASSRGDKVKVILVLVIRVMLLVLEETMQVDRQGLLSATTVKVKDIWLGNALSLSDQGMQHDPWVPDGQVVQTIIPYNSVFQTEDLDTYDSDCDDISNGKAVLIANISNYGYDVISDVPHSETYLNDMENQSVHAMQDFEQISVVDAQQDSMILSVIEQMSEQMINHVNNWKKSNKEHNNESVTAELERYKERVKTFEQHLNIDLSSREKMIDSQMDDMIKEKLAQRTS